jgi:hypothetical protein
MVARDGIEPPTPAFSGLASVIDLLESNRGSASKEEDLQR